MKKTLLLIFVIFLISCRNEEDPIYIPETIKIIETVTVEVTKVVEKEKIVYLDATYNPEPTWTPTPTPVPVWSNELVTELYSYSSKLLYPPPASVLAIEGLQSLPEFPSTT